MKSWIERLFGAWSTEPFDVELSLADVMSQLDPRWNKWSAQPHERLAS